MFPSPRAHVSKLDEVKPVVICGDLNVAHKVIWLLYCTQIELSQH